MPGRPPKPTALKLLQGNPGKRKLTPELEPASPVGAECPVECQGKAREMWKRWAPVYEAMGCLRQADALSFAAWMEIEADMQKLRAAGEHVSIAMRKQALNFAVQFGATPSARVRIHVEPKKPETKLGKFRASS